MGASKPPPGLVERIRAGDRHALHELLIAHIPDLQVFVRFNAGRELATRESIADLTQSLVGDLLPELPRARFEDLESFRAWLRRAALHKIIDKQRFWQAERRVARREADVSPSSADELDLAAALRSLSTPSQVALHQERLSLLERAMDRLPDDQRRVVTMTRLLGMSHGETAEVLERSEEACRQLLRRALRALARLMDELDPA